MIGMLTVKQNATNRTKRNRNNTSGYRNVCWIKSENMWVVQLQINGKNKRLARFPKDQLEEAGKFAEEMRKKYKDTLIFLLVAAFRKRNLKLRNMQRCIPDCHIK